MAYRQRGRALGVRKRRRAYEEKHKDGIRRQESKSHDGMSARLAKLGLGEESARVRRGAEQLYEKCTLILSIQFPVSEKNSLIANPISLLVPLGNLLKGACNRESFSR